MKQKETYEELLVSLERNNRRLIALDVISIVWGEFLEFLDKQFDDVLPAIKFCQFHKQVLEKIEGVDRVEWQWELDSFTTTVFFTDSSPMKYELKWHDT